jgi:hypothetical protein
VESIRRLTPPQLLVGAAALIVIGLVFAYLLDVGGNDDDGGADVAGFVIVTVVAVAISAFLVLWLVPREEDQAGAHRPARTSLILGILALLTLFGFWTGLPFALGVPALYLGAVGQARAREERSAAAPGESDEVSAAETPSERAGGGEALAGTVLGAVALVLGLLLCITG